MSRRHNTSNQRSVPVRWRQPKVDPVITLNLECYEEPLTYSQFQAAKAAKAEYAKSQQIITAAKEGRLVFLSDGSTKILDKPFEEVPQIQALAKIGTSLPPTISLPSPPLSPRIITSIIPSKTSKPVSQKNNGRESPDIIFVGETPPTPKAISSPVPTPSQAAKQKGGLAKDIQPISASKPSPSAISQRQSSTSEKSKVSIHHQAVAKTGGDADKKRTSRKTSVDNSATSNTNWVPLDDYYYGKTEGNPAYQEQKGEFRFKCFYCMKMLYNNVAAMQHIQGHIDSDRQVNLDISDLTQCKHCFKQFDTPFEMQTHIERVHMNNSNILLCRICEKDHLSRSMLTDHMRKCHNACEMPYVCQLCLFRSSMYSDVVDHFKKKHCSSHYFLCLYCLRIFTARFVSQGYGQTNVFYNHLLKHQMRNSTKRCQHCKLIFLNSSDLKEHRRKDHMPNQKAVIAMNADAKHSAPDQVMIKVVTDTGDAKHGGGGIKSLNVPTIKKVVEQSLSLPTSCYLKECVECRTLFGSTDHFSKYIQCSLCRFATSCSFAYANHMMSFHSGHQTVTPIHTAVERQLEAAMFCACGFSSSYGNLIATHLVSCSKTSCSTEAPSPSQTAPLHEFGRQLKDPRKKPGASLLDVLGLVKKDSLQGPKDYRQSSPSPPPVEMPEVSVANPPPRRPSLLKGSMKKPFKNILADTQRPADSDYKMSTNQDSSPGVSSPVSTEISQETSFKKREAESPRGREVIPPKRLKLSTKVMTLEEGSPIMDGTTENVTQDDLDTKKKNQNGRQEDKKEKVFGDEVRAQSKEKSELEEVEEKKVEEVDVKDGGKEDSKDGMEVGRKEEGDGKDVKEMNEMEKEEAGMEVSDDGARVLDEHGDGMKVGLKGEEKEKLEKDVEEGKDVEKSQDVEEDKDAEESEVVEEGKDVEKSQDAEESKDVEESEVVEEGKDVEESEVVEEGKDVEKSQDVEESEVVEEGKDVEKSQDVEESKDAEESEVVEEGRDIEESKVLEESESFEESKDGVDRGKKMLFEEEKKFDEVKGDLEEMMAHEDEDNDELLNDGDDDNDVDESIDFVGGDESMDLVRGDEKEVDEIGDVGKAAVEDQEENERVGEEQLDEQEEAEKEDVEKDVEEVVDDGVEKYEELNDDDENVKEVLKDDEEEVIEALSDNDKEEKTEENDDSEEEVQRSVDDDEREKKESFKAHEERKEEELFDDNEKEIEELLDDNGKEGKELPQVDNENEEEELVDDNEKAREELLDDGGNEVDAADNGFEDDDDDEENVAAAVKTTEEESDLLKDVSDENEIGMSKEDDRSGEDGKMEVKEQKVDKVTEGLLEVGGFDKSTQQSTSLFGDAGNDESLKSDEMKETQEKTQTEFLNIINSESHHNEAKQEVSGHDPDAAGDESNVEDNEAVPSTASHQTDGLCKEGQLAEEEPMQKEDNPEEIRKETELSGNNDSNIDSSKQEADVPSSALSHAVDGDRGSREPVESTSTKDAFGRSSSSSSQDRSAMESAESHLRERRDRSRSRERDRHRDRDRERDRDRDRHRDYHRDRDRYERSDRERYRDDDRRRDRHRDYDRGRERDRSRERYRDRSRERHRSRERDRGRDYKYRDDRRNYR